MSFPPTLDLKATHFKKHHTYTLEWQPGAGGYLNWCAYFTVFTLHSSLAMAKNMFHNVLILLYGVYAVVAST